MPRPLKLTLHDAVQLALKQNPAGDSGQPRRGAERAGSQHRPLRAAAALQRQRRETVNRVNLETAIGFRFPGFSQHVGPYRYEQVGANFQAPVFDLTLWRRYRASPSASTPRAPRNSASGRKVSCWSSPNTSAASAPRPTYRPPSRASISPRRSTIRRPTCKRTASAPASIPCAPTCSCRTKNSA